MKCIVVDDDSIFLELMELYIADQPLLELLGSFSDGMGAIEALKTIEPDVVFLDIQMPGVSGMELVKDLRKSAQVIFVTSHEEFAVEAFSHQVTDYLVKPINSERFNQAVRRAMETHKQRGLASEPNEIFIKINNRFQKLTYEEILSVEADGDYVQIQTTTGTHLVSTSLSAMESLLSDSHFMRTHRKNIVRIRAIQSVDRHEAILSNGSKVSISRSKKNELLSRLQSK